MGESTTWLPERMVFWGATGQAKVLRECLGPPGPRLVAVFDNDTAVPAPFEDCPIYYGSAGLRQWLLDEPEPTRVGFLVAIGGNAGGDRLAIQEQLEALGLKAIVAVHPRAFVAPSAEVGAGSQILAQATVCVDARLGRACIVNTAASVDHECRLDDGVHVAPGAHLAGLVEVGAHALIGVGAVVLPRVRIGARATVGAGAVVVRDVAAGATVVGNPARPLKGR